jgi:hypothetical protein
MSLSLIKKNSNSPFHLQRSIVSQSGEGGAYEQGGYNPDTVYDTSAATAGIVSFGKQVGAGLSSITEGDKNNANKNSVARKEKRQGKIIDKMNVDSNSDERQKQLSDRFQRIETKKEGLQKEINIYDSNQEKNLLLGHSSIDFNKPKKTQEIK